MSVAGSQSNNVLEECGLSVEGTQQQCDNQHGIKCGVWKNTSMECGSNSAVNESMKNVSGVQSGGAMKKVNSSSKPPKLKSKEGSRPPSNSTKRLREYFSSMSSTTDSGRTKGRGENLTPTKRKLIENKQVYSLLQAYTHRVQEAESIESESKCSPAKRPKLVHRGQTPQQPAAKTM